MISAAKQTMLNPHIEQAHIPANEQLYRRVPFWIACAVFFVVATPFELDASGIVYALKLLGTIYLVLYAIFGLRARVEPFHSSVVLILVLFTLVNVVSYSDRALLGSACMVVGSALGHTRGRRWEREFF